ncbi:VanZ family protein [bacterium]|nr:VanZ family protein [bacterium]
MTFDSDSSWVRSAGWWAYFLFMSTALLVPSEFLPDWLEGVDDLTPGIIPKDKILHAGSFAALLVISVWSRRSWGRFPRLEVFWCLVFAVVTEIVQSITGWRDGEWLDLLADGLGVLFGALICWGVEGFAKQKAHAPAKAET